MEKLTITISRQTGTGGLAIAQKLAKHLDKHGPAPGKPWTVFDKNLVEEVLKQHNLPAELADFLSEERTSELQNMVEEVLGLHPSSWELVRRVTETILNLAELGNVILVGRGANLITARLEHAVHVRIVGSLERRVARLQRYEKVSEKTAQRMIKDSDQARERYVKKHFKQDVNDPLLYDLVLNTDRISDEAAAGLIAQAALARCG
jgi:cytidylate kinase